MSKTEALLLAQMQANNNKLSPGLAFVLGLFGFGLFYTRGLLIGLLLTFSIILFTMGIGLIFLPFVAMYDAKRQNEKNLDKALRAIASS